MKRHLFKLRLRLLLRWYSFSQGVEFWIFSSLKEDDKKVQHRRECDKIMLSFQPEERELFMDWKKKKIDWLVYENTKDKSDIMQQRLFQALLEYKQIKALHEADRMRKEEQRLA